MIACTASPPVGEIVDRGDEIQIFGDREIVIETESLRHIADLQADPRRIAEMSRPRQVPPPPSGFTSPHSIRIVVVLPLPLAPRKPQISPVCHRERQAVDNLARAIALVQIAHIDHQFAVHGAARFQRAHFDRLARIEVGRPGRAAAWPRQKHQLGLADFAVDQRRRVFGLRRNERDRAGQAGRAAVAGQSDRIAQMQRAENGSGTKNRTKILPGGSSDTTGCACRHRLAWAGEHIGHASGGGRGDTALREPPLGHVERRLRGRRPRRAAPAISPSRPIGARACASAACNRRDLGLGRVVIGPQLIDVLLRDGSLRQQTSPRRRSAVARTSVALASARLASACWISVGLPPAWRLASCSSACASCCAAWSRAARSSVSSCVNSGAPAATSSPRATTTAVSRPGWVGPTLTKSASA